MGTRETVEIGGEMIPRHPSFTHGTMSERQRLREISEALRFAMGRMTSRERPIYTTLLGCLQSVQRSRDQLEQTPPPIDQSLPWER